MPKLKPSAPMEAQQKRVDRELLKFKEGTLHSGSRKGPKVTDGKQAIAIALAEAGLSKRGRARTTKKTAEQQEPQLPAAAREVPGPTASLSIPGSHADCRQMDFGLLPRASRAPILRQ
jgi:hypothetical protein